MYCSWVRTESGLGRLDSVRTQFGLVRASSVWTQSATVHRASLRIPSEHGRLGARAEPEGRRRRPGPAVGQLPHHRRSLRTRRHLCDQLLDLSLGRVGRPLQEIVPILRREVRRQLRDPGQMKAPVGQHRQQHRVLPRRARRRDAQVGLGLREVKDLRAPGEHRGRGLAGVEPARVHLADVGHEVGLGAPALPPGAPPDDGAARHPGSSSRAPCVLHADNIGSVLSDRLGSRVFDATADNGLEKSRARLRGGFSNDAPHAAHFLRLPAVLGRMRCRKLSRGKCRSRERSIGSGDAASCGGLERWRNPAAHEKNRQLNDQNRQLGDPARGAPSSDDEPRARS